MLGNIGSEQSEGAIGVTAQDQVTGEGVSTTRIHIHTYTHTHIHTYTHTHHTRTHMTHPHHKHVQYIPTHRVNSKHLSPVGNYMCMEPLQGRLRFIGCDDVFALFVIELSEYAEMVADGIISEL